ncbi:REP-associated tyrosine transposase [Aquisalimonas sp. APHAB1-3]|uniref:REP-associated tyrosine transposase n=1 Tax=Aquisalimonas sp. APHAB1-3 TaxID=3402080 RepID=UPI003AAEC5D1
MSRYCRTRVPGGTYFFTVVTHDRLPLFTSDANVQRLRTALRRTHQAHPFRIDAMVVLPDHLHALWTLPADDADYPRRWKILKALFTQSQPDLPGEYARRAGGAPVWQRRYREHLIRDETDFRRHRDYIHYNPVKHGLVAHPGAWPHSSFHRAVERGWYPPDWGASEPQTVVGVEFE